MAFTLSRLPDLLPEVLPWTIVLALPAVLLHNSVSRSPLQLSAQRLIGFLTATSFYWFTIVSDIVPQPYLDEIFHIPQAQKYCEERFFEWDDKITTPPGLYLASIYLPTLTRSLGFSEWYLCTPKSLRATNVVGLVLLTYLALMCRDAIERLFSPGKHGRDISRYAYHTALNVGLFPLLFFFSGLYYTDVLSTAAVLASFLNHLGRVSSRRTSLLSDAMTIILGLATLWMRQTNVFWVVVFLGGLEAVHAIKTLQPQKFDQPVMTTLWDQLKFFAWRYSVGDVHDVSIDKAYPEDMLFTVASVGIAAICNPFRIISQIWPHLVVLASFAGFVAWNGSVVLGDKSNHVATIHFAQLLYMWPFFAFFSLPLLLPVILRPFQIAEAIFPGNAEPKKKTESTATLSPPLKIVSNIFNYRLLWPVYIALSLLASVAVVKFNTIIHPFTLADNRHYMFYIFRYTIRRSEAHRLLLIVPYTLTRWVAWDALGGFKSWTSSGSQPTDARSDPFWIASKTRRRQTLESEAQDADPSSNAVATSTGLIFLLATSLSLVTAPLVEPRYFIVPWVIWRLMTPSWKVPTTGSVASLPVVQAFASLFKGCDPRLLVETAWHMLINAATGYIFLYRPYIWRAEDGTVLEGGNLQRFMW